jgi:hypothetical protein
MLLELALMAAIHKTNPELPSSTTRQYAQWVLAEAKKTSLDPWLFQALIHRESRWHPTVVRHERDGSCSVGLGQINGPCKPAVVAPMLDPHANIQRMGAFLSGARDRCRTDCGDLGWLRAYNPGDQVYLQAIKKAVANYHGETQ